MGQSNLSLHPLLLWLAKENTNQRDYQSHWGIKLRRRPPLFDRAICATTTLNSSSWGSSPLILNRDAIVPLSINCLASHPHNQPASQSVVVREGEGSFSWVYLHLGLNALRHNKQQNQLGLLLFLVGHPLLLLNGPAMLWVYRLAVASEPRLRQLHQCLSCAAKAFYFIGFRGSLEAGEASVGDGFGVLLKGVGRASWYIFFWISQLGKLEGVEEVGKLRAQ